jgi:hypothetical protein
VSSAPTFRSVASGSIRGCIEERFEGVAVADELRKCLLLEDSDQFDLFSDDERKELIFRLFTHLCVGGGMCQWEGVSRALCVVYGV